MSPSPLVGVADAAARLGISRPTLRRFIARGLVPAVRLPSGILKLDREAVERLGTPTDLSIREPRST
jgi:excisionase family DNA binding protein